MMRLALAQAPADLATPKARLHWLAGILADVTKERADLLLLPELFACGYHIGSDVPARAEVREGPTFQAISALAQQHSIAIHYGYAEQAEGQIFNAAQCIAPDGTSLSHQRKLAIPPGWERDFFTAGQGCALFDYAGLRIATLICYDAEFAETVRHVAGLGADLVLVPTALGAGWPWVAGTMIPTRAYENGVYLAYANSAGTENGMDFLGASFIAAPNGVELARAGKDPQVIHAEINKDSVTAAQTRLPYLQDRLALKLS